ncbi:TraR/DksA C4-type zinc finger protein [Pseudoalteromonas rubra]|uniref:TraR/DksA C4-type zinc finger protein n=1 Tax=Pseudoalteromonas rubra TaxID=43658 RepID=UPI000F798415|nr:TraR/DksA C4-type zinc finger protein [Pseudoalteromonas rubra]
MQAPDLTSATLSVEQMLAAPESDYMNAAQQAFFRQRLVELHDSTRARIRDTKAQIMNPPELVDLSDRASWEEQCLILMRIVDREQKLLPKIQQALERIRLNEYGYCLETGEPIGIARLLARPTAELCADVKLCSELKEHMYVKERHV